MLFSTNFEVKTFFSLSSLSRNCIPLWVKVRVFNATFNNISVEETRLPGENHRPAASP